MIRTLAAALATSTCIVALATPAAAQTREYNIPAGSLKSALDAYVRQSGRQVVYRADEVRSARSPGVHGQQSADAALTALLAGSGFATRVDGNLVAIVKSSGNGPDAGSSATSSREDGLEADIVVTGSLIRGVTDSASPLTQYKREDIQRSGYGSLEEFFSHIPQNFAGTVSQSTANSSPDTLSQSNRSFGSAITLRGLGVGTTLTLLNGHRLAPSGNRGGFTDISVIPIEAIERVDVLTDGASALYGSDAIGGVVNFILRRDYSGLETAARFGLDNHGKAQELRLAQTGGLNWATGNAILSFEHYQKQPIYAEDRSYTSVPLGSDATISPRQNRETAFLTARQELGSDLELTADALYSVRNASDRGFSSVNPNPLGSTSRSEQVSGSGGLNWTPFPKWDVRLTGSYSEATDKFSAQRSPPFSDSIGRNRSTLTSFDLISSGPLFSIAGGDIKAAVGASYRHESFSYRFGFGGPPILSPSAGRNVYSAFGELLIPIVGPENSFGFVDKIEASAAARYDRYSDFGSSFVPKFGGRVTVFKDWTIRSTYSESFRAPLLNDLVERPALLLLYAPDPLHLFGNSGQALELLNAGAGNSALSPEKSSSWTLGLDYVPRGSRLRMSLSYYSIRYNGKIDQPLFNTDDALVFPNVYAELISGRPSSQMVTQLIQQAGNNFFNIAGPDFGPLEPFNPSLVDVYVDGRTRNIGFEEQSGLDLSIGTTFDLAGGNTSLNAAGTFILRGRRRITASSALVETINDVYRPVDFRSRASASWTKGRASLAATLNYVDGYENRSTSPSSKVGSWATLDTSISYAVPEQSAGPLSGTRFTLSISNAFNTAPPFIGRGPSGTQLLGYDPANANPFGRFFSFEIRKHW